MSRSSSPDSTPTTERSTHSKASDSKREQSTRSRSIDSTAVPICERLADPADRAEMGPLPALVATVVVCAALALYATGLYASFPESTDPRVAEPTLERAATALAPDGVVDPDRLSDALSSTPAGYESAFVLSTGDDRWRVGPASPPDAATAARPVTVRIAPGVVVDGRLRVEVWR